MLIGHCKSMVGAYAYVRSHIYQDPHMHKVTGSFNVADDHL